MIIRNSLPFNSVPLHLNLYSLDHTVGLICWNIPFNTDNQLEKALFIFANISIMAI